MIAEGDRAYSWDLDDTLIGRERITRGFELIKATFKPYHLPLFTLDEIPDIVREIVDEPINGLSERISFEMHARRKVLPGVRNLLEEAKEAGIVNVGNTGRSNKRPWVEMSRATLERGEIAYLLDDAFFTPDGVTTAVSKASGIRELKKNFELVEHFEDDPRTAAYLASLFPDVTVHLIQYGSTNLLYSRQEIDQYPNIRRVGIITDIQVTR